MFVLPSPRVLEELFTCQVALLDALFCQTVHHLGLRRNRSVVGSRHPAGILAIDAGLPDENVLDGIVEHVAHVQHSAEKLVVYPILVPFALYFRGIIFGCKFHIFPYLILIGYKSTKKISLRERELQISLYFCKVDFTLMHTKEEKLEAFGRLLDVMDDLREKCPWDRKQTNESLRPNTIEETFELCDALLKNDNENICKELGDVLLHVVFYAKIGSEKGDFDIADVCNKLCDKLIYRHPHVYGDAVANTAGEVLKSWEQIKQTEKDGNKSVLGGVPDALPSLIKAYRIQEKARNVGFDWDKPEDVWDKVQEELDELKAELRKEGNQKRQDEEYGDFLFSLINAGRLYHINPDNALEYTNQKFIRRFNYVEQKAKEQGLRIKDMTLAQMDALWNEAKSLEQG